LKSCSPTDQKGKTDGLVIAVFVTPHGFGHATRVGAILTTLSKKVQISKIIFLGKTPAWFWQGTLPSTINFVCLDENTDVGLVQDTPFAHNLNETKRKLEEFLKQEKKRSYQLFRELQKHCTDLVISDISSLGIKVGNLLGIPNILIENFTWPWIYEVYAKNDLFFRKSADHLRKCYDLVDLRIQCSPYCESVPSSKKISPVFRPPVSTVEETKRKLQIPEKFVLISTGGISLNYRDYNFNSSGIKVVAPCSIDEPYRQGNTFYIPINSGIYFPDLVYASSAIIGKAGYGTVSEAWGMNKPFFGIYRKDFAESAKLREFTKANLDHKEIEESDLRDLSWLNDLKLPQHITSIRKENGAEQAAELIFRTFCL